MKFISILLSVISFQYGFIFFPKQSRFVRYIGLIIFLNHLFLEFYNIFNRNWSRNSFINWIGYEIYYVGSVIYGFVIIKNGKKIIDHILSNLYFINRFQYIVLCSSITIILFFYLTGLVISCVVYVVQNELWLFTGNVVLIISTVSSSPNLYWTLFSSIIYSIMYLEMHLKHMNILAHIKEKKNYSHLLIYKLLIQIQSDYKNFDNLVSIFPGLWLTTFFLGLTSNVFYFTGNKFHKFIFIIYFANVSSWFFVYILVNFLKSFLCARIKSIEYDVVIDCLIDEQRVFRFLDQMADTHVTAFHLFKFDKGLFLPYMGSVLSWTFLFVDKFKGST